MGSELIRMVARGVIASLAYAGIGIAMFALAWFVINKVTPFSIRKELQDDQNLALGILLASVIIGIAMIVSAAVHG